MKIGSNCQHTVLEQEYRGDSNFHEVQHEYVTIAVDSPKDELKFAIEAVFLTESQNWEPDRLRDDYSLLMNDLCYNGQ